MTRFTTHALLLLLTTITLAMSACGGPSVEIDDTRSEEERERQENGIPLQKEVIEWFCDITAELSLPGLRTI